jgi:4,5-dihydroxyphthalate decarboxylase
VTELLPRVLQTIHAKPEAPMSSTTLTMALERYDRHVPFFDGTVRKPSGFALKALQVGHSHPLPDGVNRHGGMLKGKYDIAEFSMSTFLMAIDRGLPIIGIPVFPRRLFSAGLIYVRADSNATHPTDLLGKRVAIRSFQTTLSLLAKGDLKLEYATPWEKIHWLVQDAEKIAFEPKPGVRIERLSQDADVGQLLLDGGCDAVIQPYPPKSIASGNAVRRLFENADAEELRYYRKYGWWPIMHIIALRNDVVEKHTNVCRELMETFKHARELSWSYFADPNWSSLAWGRRYYERERSDLGRDPWVFGMESNRGNLEQMIKYSQDQGLVRRRVAVEELFHPSVLDT